MSEWQPIATAPRDGSAVDLWHVNGYRVADARWQKGASGVGGWDWGDGLYALGDQQFTHWMPVPAPPE